MQSLLPDVASAVERASEALSRGRDVVVTGSVGSGRTTLVDALEAGIAGAVVLDLLPLSEADAPASGLLQAIAAVTDLTERRRLMTLTVNIGDAASQTARALGSRTLIVRMPGGWRLGSGTPDDDAVKVRAHELVRSLTGPDVRAVVVADEWGAADQLRLANPVTITLAHHNAGRGFVDQVEWAAYTGSARELVAAATDDLNTSPLAWRLAVGAIALGTPANEAVEALRAGPSLNPLVQRILGGLHGRSALREALARFVQIRRPVPASIVAAVTGAGPDDLPLFTHCLGYGNNLVRITPIVRRLLSAATSKADGVEGAHLVCADHFESLDGVTEPATLTSGAVVAWCEKVHHLGRSGSPGASRWEAQRKVAPEQYWDRARHLSINHRDHAGAATVYRACTEAFSTDDYGWHYFAYNNVRAHGDRAATELAFRRAVELAPDNPWWNQRLVRFLIRDGQPHAAVDTWRAAIERIDPDGSRVAQDAWLAWNVHAPVAETWLRAGRPAIAAAVVDQLPDAVVNACPPEVSRTLKRIRASDPRDCGEDVAWKKFLADLETRTDVDQVLARQVRKLWHALRAKWGAALPIPMAHRGTAGDTFVLAWSYRAATADLEVHRDGRVDWYARDRATGKSAGTEDPEPFDASALDPWIRKVIDA